jgi:hypothetical protein
MSSTATFYRLSVDQRTEFTTAQRQQKTVQFKRTLFGRKEVITGDRYLWEYLDSAAADRSELPYSGFAFIDYFFSFVCPNLPAPLEAELKQAALDDHYFAFSGDLASRLASYLKAHAPDTAALTTFAQAQDSGHGPDYVACLSGTHDFLVDWFGSVGAGRFGVLHLTF